ncbi:exocyst complex component 3-like [Colossoma macropomum]|uniref:exocyst complex component 3-like n=1 Tax=Colossoma macropomum TaxID=42526 RepID=UPI0018646154|nr:exocyst complex component 3-like [Colossoma macropomum]
MSKVLKKLNRKLKRKRGTGDEDSRKPLVSNATLQLTEPVDGDSITQTFHCLNSTDQSGTDPEIQAQDSEDEGQRVLSILRDVLLGDLRSQELKQAAEQVKQWAKVNGITPEGKEGSYSQNWLREYLDIVEMSVDKHFSALPPEGSRDSQLQPGEYLKYLSLVWSKVTGLVPVLENSRLLSYLIDSYNRRLFAVLDLLMDRSSTVKETSILLQWVKQTYFSHCFTGSPNIQDHVLRVSDPLLLTGWFEKSKQKFLTLLQEHISTVLQNILLYSEAPCDCRNEEDLIKVHLDVIQCLDAALQSTKLISDTLITAVQRLCCDELHTFVERYVNDEKKHLEAQNSNETYSLHLFRVIDTCKHLRSYTLDIMDSNNNTDSSTLLMLENMEAQVVANLQQWMAGLAEQSVSDDEQKMFLLKMSEILGCNDINALKLICAALYRDFPKER